MTKEMWPTGSVRGGTSLKEDYGMITHLCCLQIRLPSVQPSQFGYPQLLANDGKVPSIKRLHCSRNDVGAYGRHVFFRFELCAITLVTNHGGASITVGQFFSRLITFTLSLDGILSIHRP